MLLWLLLPAGFEDNPGGAWEPLIQGFIKGGWRVTLTPDISQPIDALVAVNRDVRMARLAQFRAIPRSRRALVLMEPRVTAPLAHSRLTRESFPRIYAASPAWASSPSDVFDWPQDLEPTQGASSPPLLNRPFRASLIAANKRSAVCGSLYGLRREVIGEAHRRGISLAVVGRGWASSRQAQMRNGMRSIVKAVTAGCSPDVWEAMHRSSPVTYHYLGEAPVKQGALDLAPLSIVIENSADYVSEKLVDVIRGGSVPVYVGPSLRNFGIPDDIAIPVRPSTSSIIRTVTDLADAAIVGTAARGRAWLRSNEARSLDRRVVLQRLGARIGSDLAGRSLPRRTGPEV